MASRFPGDTNLILWCAAIGLFAMTVIGIGRMIWQFASGLV